MKSYLSRHKKDPSSPKTPGELSRILLWSDGDWKKAKRNFEVKHGVKV
jgi:hypothetical protein